MWLALRMNLKFIFITLRHAVTETRVFTGSICFPPTAVVSGTGHYSRYSGQLHFYLVKDFSRIHVNEDSGATPDLYTAVSGFQSRPS